MRPLWRRLVGRRAERSARVSILPRIPTPREALCLVGDVHGRADLLERLVSLRNSHFPHARLVFLGDAIDRGDDSAAVLGHLQGLCAEGAIFLRGNHEDMLLKALERPVEVGRYWLANGGLQTLASFGVSGDLRGPDGIAAALSALREKMGDATLSWLRERPLSWQSGDLVTSHAGMDPGKSLSDQTERDLLWGHPRFRATPRADGLWVAHGHFIVDHAHCREGRIALDTGAYATGALSYAVVDPQQAEHDRVVLGVARIPGRESFVMVPAQS